MGSALVATGRTVGLSKDSTTRTFDNLKLLLMTALKLNVELFVKVIGRSHDK